MEKELKGPKVEFSTKITVKSKEDKNVTVCNDDTQSKRKVR